MAILIENEYPNIQSDGLNTKKNVNLQGAGILSGQLDNVVLQTGSVALPVTSSGTVQVFNSTTGFTLTLPAPTVGLNYNFVVGKAPTSGSHAIATNASTVFLNGTVNTAIASSTNVTYVADGSTHVAYRMNGTTTGGSAGTYVSVVAISSTIWAVEGQGIGSGVLTIPFFTG